MSSTEENLVTCPLSALCPSLQLPLAPAGVESSYVRVSSAFHSADCPGGHRAQAVPVPSTPAPDSVALPPELSQPVLSVALPPELLLLPLIGNWEAPALYPQPGGFGGFCTSSGGILQVWGC